MNDTSPVPASTPVVLFPAYRGTLELVFESAKTVEQLRAELRQTLGPVWDIGSAGPKGWVLGSWVRVGWLPRWTRYFQRCHLAFRGRVESTPTGSRLRGRIRMNGLLMVVVALGYIRIVAAFLAWACTSNVYYGWGLVITLACAVFMGLALSLGGKVTTRHVCQHLTAVCGPVRSSASTEGGRTAQVTADKKNG